MLKRRQLLFVLLGIEVAWFHRCLEEVLAIGFVVGVEQYSVEILVQL